MRFVSQGSVWVLFFSMALARAEDLSKFEIKYTPEQRQHWAFRPLHRPAVPRVQNAAWVRSPIDSFILAQLEAGGWHPAPAVEDRAFARRLYLDLTGLPPTPREMQKFLNDCSPGAVSALVDELLARPGYGERWGRHWLDLVRYADSNGYERDGAKPSAWRYRDYVIRSFNSDKPYDRFVQEQLAGDELPDASAETMIGLGFTRLGPWDDEPADPQEDRFDQLDDIVSTTSQAFLGMTLGCARCHNHKFEPLAQLDYYRMLAIFDPLQRPAGARQDLDLPALPPKQWNERCISAATATLSGSALARGGMLASLGDVPRGYFLRESHARLPVTHLLIRGKSGNPGPAVTPGVPRILCADQPRFTDAGPFTSGRRLTLARWIVRSPLAARVIVNRIWQFHFGEGLVRTPSDFGINGQPPTHPELLEWLATEFIRQGWSIKQLHREILKSNTYRMSKRCDTEAFVRADPENRLWAHFPYRRLDVEAIRDSVLLVSGQLNRRLYGPSMYPEVPREALAANSDPDKIWKASSEEEAARRTIYAFIKRSMVVPLFEVLDLCDTTRTAAQRLTTTVAPQALSLFNGAFIRKQAEHLANRLEREAGPDPTRQINLAFQLALCRAPTRDEKDAMLNFLSKDSPRRGLEQVCRILFNLNEFVYPD
jgi:hypothetical protein